MLEKADKVDRDKTILDICFGCRKRIKNVVQRRGQVWRQPEIEHQSLSKATDRDDINIATIFSDTLCMIVQLWNERIKKVKEQFRIYFVHPRSCS